MTELLIAADWLEEHNDSNGAAQLRTALVSETAEQRGFGTDRYKRVVNLTTEEREHARAGGVVLFRSSRLSGGNSGTYWRMAVDQGRYGFAPRVPPAEWLQFLQ